MTRQIPNEAAGDAANAPTTEPLSVSVAMATFNGAKFIDEQLSSLRRQKRLPGELLVVDDGSTDATVAKVEAFARSAPFPVRLERNPSRLGWRDNFFKAMGLCQKELIALCDQDDVWHENKLARCAALFERRRDLALVVHAGRVVSEDLRPTRRRWPPIRRTRILAPDRVPMGFGYHGMALMFPRWLLDAVSATSRPAALAQTDALFMNHDLWVCLIAPTVGSVALLAEELVLYRRHDATASQLRPDLGGASGWRALFDVEAKEREYHVIAGRRRQTVDYLTQLGECHDALPSGQIGFRTSRQASYHARLSVALDRRAEVIHPDASRGRRILRLAELVTRRGYGRVSRGGLGLKRAPFDLAVALLGPRRKKRARIA